MDISSYLSSSVSMKGSVHSGMIPISLSDHDTSSAQKQLVADKNLSFPFSVASATNVVKRPFDG